MFFVNEKDGLFFFFYSWSNTKSSAVVLTNSAAMPTHLKAHTVVVRKHAAHAQSYRSGLSISAFTCQHLCVCV